MPIRPCTLLTVAVATVAIALTPSAATTQEGDWQRRIAEADSIEPEPPDVDPSPGAACGPGVELSDSVQVSGPADEFLSRAASLRTAGYFTRFRFPDEGAGRFALLRVTCDPETGRPVHFTLERDHRYFYLGFILRAWPTFHALRFRSPAGTWEAFRWDTERRTFSAQVDTARPDFDGDPPVR
jgi:hypothetical protein